MDCSENLWPKIRKERINILLLKALEASEVDCWLVICRENHNDPIANHIGGENAGGTAAFLFYRDDSGFHSLAFSPDGEATSLDELDIHDKVVKVERGKSTFSEAVNFIKEKDFRVVTVNSSPTNAMADGLSYSQRIVLEELMGDDSKKIVSSTELIYGWLSIKLPQEVEIMRKAAQLAADWQVEAYAMVKPGEVGGLGTVRGL